ncbi:MAG: hypothetical protein HQK67_12970 [Desulfamplus sp.]|nr:hypothetical protein [Desulfamplus sp.]
MGNLDPFFQQASTPEREQIVSLKSGDADAFIKILNQISPLINTATIIDSRLTALISDTSLIDIKFDPIFHESININMDLNNIPTEKLKIFKSNKGVLISDDVEFNAYRFENGKRVVLIPKANHINSDVLPDLSKENTVVIGKEFETDESSLIKPFCKKSDYEDIAVFGDQFGYVQRHIPGQPEDLVNQIENRYYFGEFSSYEYENRPPSYLFRSNDFLPISGSLVTLEIVELKSLPGCYCLKTKVDIGFQMSIDFYENITLVGRN